MGSDTKDEPKLVQSKGTIYNTEELI